VLQYTTAPTTQLLLLMLREGGNGAAATLTGYISPGLKALRCPDQHHAASEISNMAVATSTAVVHMRCQAIAGRRQGM